MKSDSTKTSAIIPAEPAAVYAAWMSTKGHSEMTGNPAKVTARVGSSFSAWDGYISGKTLELKKDERIVQSWRSTDFADEDPDSRLEVILEKAKGGTRVTLLHTNIPAGHGAEYKAGWIDYYFKPMKAYFGAKK